MTGVGGGAAGAAGGAAGGMAGGGGSGVVDDPCTACEKAKCSHPQGWAADGNDPTDVYAGLAGAYEVCFVGTGWPSTVADPDTFCGGLQGAEGTAAANGPAQGTAKTTLCQDLLKCIHQSNCTGGPVTDNQQQCYCGVDVDLQTCEGAGTKPTGLCASQIADALESNQFANSAGFFGDQCLANGAAFYLYDWCDTRCCATECFGSVPAGVRPDASYCNASGSAGSSGTGGTTGTGGHGGSPGTGGAPGLGGSGGTTGSGGSSGGSPGTGGVSGVGGSSGGSAGGSAGASGGSAGAPGGSAGTSGMPGALQNGQFDSSTAPWMPSLGATLSRSTNDSGGSGQSGSLDVVLTNGDPTLTSLVAADQCISATPGATYNLSVEILVPGSMLSQGGLNLWYYSSTNCSGPIASVFSAPSSTNAAWQQITAATQVPFGVQSMDVRLSVLKPLGQQSAEALFDNVVVAKQ